MRESPTNFSFSCTSINLLFVRIYRPPPTRHLCCNPLSACHSRDCPRYPFICSHGHLPAHSDTQVPLTCSQISAPSSFNHTNLHLFAVYACKSPSTFRRISLARHLCTSPRPPAVRVHVREFPLLVFRMSPYFLFVYAGPRPPIGCVQIPSPLFVRASGCSLFAYLSPCLLNVCKNQHPITRLYAQVSDPFFIRARGSTLTFFFTCTGHTGLSFVRTGLLSIHC